MSDRDFGYMDERDFEAMLETSVPELPPDDVVKKVTPWRKAMGRVLLGMALCNVTFNFLYLDTVLPALGLTLSLLGFRTLRRENRWFGGLYVLTILRAAIFFPVLVLKTAIIQSAVLASPAAAVLTAVNLAQQPVGYFCLWRGLRTVQRKVGLPPRAGSAAALILWFALMCVLVLIDYRGIVIICGLLIAYIFIILNIYKLSKELDEAGYSIKTAPVRVTDGCIVLLLLSALIVGGALGYTFGGSYPMDWRPVEPGEQAGVEDIKGRLSELGFPEYVLRDLTAEDIAACDGALQVVTEVSEHPVNDGRVETTQRYDGEQPYIEQKTVYDVKELQVTGIGVELPGDRWIIFHHFLWSVDPGFYGTESIQLWPVYQGLSGGWAPDGDVTGRVLYDMDGESFTAPYYFLGDHTYTSDSIFWGSQTNTDVFAAFSMPRKGENYRGYVAYPVCEVEEDYIISSWFNYTHQRTWLQYPAVTAMEKRMTGGFNDDGAFITVQDALQFYGNSADIN